MAGNAAIAQHMKEMRDGFQRGGVTLELRTLGYGQTHGRFFPFREGMFVLQRRELYPTPGPWRICGLAKLSDTTIANRAAYGHGANTAWHYTAAHVLGNGQTSACSEPRRLDFDGAGAIITPALPLWPIATAAVAIGGGKFRLSWQYNSWGQGGWPNDFVIFQGPDKDSIDYGTIIATVPFDPQTRFHSFETGAYAEAARRAFAIRARNSGGVAERNESTTEIAIARLTAPLDAVIQSVATRKPGGQRER